MPRTTAAALALVLLAMPASGSFIEQTLAPTGLTYQADGGIHGDAPDTCETVMVERGVVLDGGEPSSGMLVEMDDESDAYGFVLDQSTVGERVVLEMLTGLLVDRYNIAFDVRSPDCGSSVFDPESAYYDPAPEQPYQPPVGSLAFEAVLTGHACDVSQWKFLANQMGGLPAPADIYVEWTNGEYAYVPVSKSTPATVAMYLTSANLDVTVARAIIVLPAWYTGQFKIASGPCDAVVGEPGPEPTLDTRYGEFTVQEAGDHVVLVFITRGTVEKTQDTVMDLAGPSTATQRTCHTDLCSLALRDASYDLSALKQQAA